MFGRLRAAASSVDSIELERPASKMIKDDPLSIYEATLEKLRLGSRRALSPCSTEKIKIDAPCSSAEEETKTDPPCSSGEEEMMTDPPCSSAPAEMKIDSFYHPASASPSFGDVQPVKNSKASASPSFGDVQPVKSSKQEIEGGSCYSLLLPNARVGG